MSLSPFTTLHDSEFFQFQTLRRRVLASEARRKEEQRRMRERMGLPEVEFHSKGLISRVLGLGSRDKEVKKARKEECQRHASVEKRGGEREKGGVSAQEWEACDSSSLTSSSEGSRICSMQVVDMKDVLGEKMTVS